MFGRSVVPRGGEGPESGDRSKQAICIAYGKDKEEINERRDERKDGEQKQKKAGSRIRGVKNDKYTALGTQ